MVKELEKHLPEVKEDVTGINCIFLFDHGYARSISGNIVGDKPIDIRIDKETTLAQFKLDLEGKLK
jgi:hypothetical protein